MDQQSVEPSHTQDGAGNEAEKKTVHWRHVFDWGFWSDHPLAVIALFIGGIFLASITSFPGGNPKQLWYFAFGLWVVLGAIIWWVFGGIIARMQGRELLTNQEIQEREETYRTGIQSQLDSLDDRVGETQRRVAEQQRRRRLTASQKEAIKSALAPYSGQKILVFYPLGDAEASQYAWDFGAVFREAGLHCPPEDIRGTFFPADFENVIAAASKPHADTAKEKFVPPDVLAPLVKVLMDLGLSDNRGLDPKKEVNLLEDVKAGEVGLRVGTKLPPIE